MFAQGTGQQQQWSIVEKEKVNNKINHIKI